MTSPSGAAGRVDAAPRNKQVLRLVAPNPGPMSLEGTNTYIVGRDPAFVIDPGPADSDHLDAIRSTAQRLGGIGGVLLTHSHRDHSDGAARLGAPVLWGEVGMGDESSWAEPAPSPGRVPDRIGPFRLVPTPGHAADHVCFVAERVCFCGDLILGRGSSIVPPAALGGSLVDYMHSLRSVAELDVDLLCPGHGPWITDPAAKVAEYAEHRLDRERRLVSALEEGERSRGRLLDEVWDDVPEPLRPAAAFAMQAHLEKLEAEGRLPDSLHD
jgi:glyoxylase-like metal-dependent hydrolase (beta-lactamase superfamily II)